MKNTIQISLVTLVSLVLFACDSSTSTKKTDTGGGDTPTTFSVSANVTGLGANTLIITNNLNTNEKSFNSDGQSEILTGLAENSSYGISLKSDPIGKNCVLGSNAASNSISADVVVSVSCNTIAVGVISDGKDYYMSECAVCHQSGIDDPDGAFAVADLAKNYQNKTGLNGIIIITPDMHNIGTDTQNLMGRFDSISEQVVADLEAYFAQVTF